MSLSVLCSGLAAILNATFLLAAITHVRRITVSYPLVHCSVRYSSVTPACSLWDYSLQFLRSRFHFAIGSRTLAFRYRRYGRPTLVTGLLVYNLAVISERLVKWSATSSCYAQVLY